MKKSLSRTPFLVLLFILSAAGSASAGMLESAQGFDWKDYIEKIKPSTVKQVSIYVGGPHPFQLNGSSIRYRPASTLKIFTAAAYLAHRFDWSELAFEGDTSKDKAWDKITEKDGYARKIPRFLKKSVNEIGDLNLAPKLGGGNYSKGVQLIEKYTNQMIANRLRRSGIEPELRQCFDEYTCTQALKNPYQVFVESGSGIDGAESRLKGRNLERSLVTAEGMRLFLEELTTKPYFMPILRSLPYAGTDGTLRGRMEGQNADYKIAAKTGSVNEIKHVAGYIHVKMDGESKYIPFVILINHNERNLPKTVAFADALMNKMADELGADKIPFKPLD